MNRIPTPSHPTRKKRECGARRSLRMKPEQYTLQPVCKVCGGRKWGLDNHRRKVELPEQEKCGCDGVRLTLGSGYTLHRKGSKGCWYHKDAIVERGNNPVQNEEIETWHSLEPDLVDFYDDL